MIHLLCIALAFVLVVSSDARIGGSVQTSVDLLGIGPYNSDGYKQNVTLVTTSSASFCECTCYNAPAPTAAPTAVPTATPSAVPSANPSVVPSAVPSATPTFKPTSSPTEIPTPQPSARPTFLPTTTPSAAPTAAPLSGSLCTNGGVQYLSSNLVQTIGSGDFTVEFWFYSMSNSATQGIVGFGPYSSLSTTNGRFTVFWCYPGKKSQVFAQDAAFKNNYNEYTNATTLNTWHHIAVVRSSGTIKIYLDGVNNGRSDTWTTNYNNNKFVLFRDYADLSQEYFKGCITGFAVSRTAVYTSSFTPSKKEIVNDPTKILILNAASSASALVDSSSYGNTFTNNGAVTYSTSHP